MYIRHVETIEQLAPYQGRWDDLGNGSVFRCWAWLSTWWRYYGEKDTSRKLSVFLLFDGTAPEHCQEPQGQPDADSADSLVAILPCYLLHTLHKGNSLRLIGDGEVCSEYLGIISSIEREAEAAHAFATYLRNNFNNWDIAEFFVVANTNLGMNILLDALHSESCQTEKKVGPNCWSIELPTDWEEFLMGQSKSHRKQLRRLERRVQESESAVWHLVESSSDFEIAWSIFTDLHQRRRESLGEPGCFASNSWASFHRDVAQQLLLSGNLRLSWLELAGQPIAAEYHFVGSNKTLAYQGGLDPDRLEEEPGKLSMIIAIKHAIEEGHAYFDLLRGDEPYKPHWRASPQPTFDYYIVPPRSGARWRYQAWTSVHRVTRLARSLAKLLSYLAPLNH